MVRCAGGKIPAGGAANRGAEIASPGAVCTPYRGRGLPVNNKKEEKHMGITEAVMDTITDRSAVLSLKQVKVYADRAVERGGAEYNNGSILVRSKHPLDQCARRGIIEDQHYDTGKAFITI